MSGTLMIVYRKVFGRKQKMSCKTAHMLSSAPLVLMHSLAFGVLTWQHIVGHTYTTAQSMHLPPIVLMTCISSCTGAVVFFFCMAIKSIIQCVWFPSKRIEMSPYDTSSEGMRQDTYEYYNEEPEGSQSDRLLPLPPQEEASKMRRTLLKVPEDDASIHDIDAKAYKDTGAMQAKTERLNEDGRLSSGDILTLTMVYSLWSASESIQQKCVELSKVYKKCVELSEVYKKCVECARKYTTSDKLGACAGVDQRVWSRHRPILHELHRHHGVDSLHLFVCRRTLCSVHL